MDGAGRPQVYCENLMRRFVNMLSFLDVLRKIGWPGLFSTVYLQWFRENQSCHHMVVYYVSRCLEILALKRFESLPVWFFSDSVYYGTPFAVSWTRPGKKSHVQGNLVLQSLLLKISCLLIPINARTYAWIHDGSPVRAVNFLAPETVQVYI